MARGCSEPKRWPSISPTYHPHDGALNIRSGKGGYDRRGFLTGAVQDAVDDWLVPRGDAPPWPAFPDDLRRSFVSDLFDAGADLAAVQGLNGHRRPEATVRYDRRPAAGRRPPSTFPVRSGRSVIV